MRNPLKSYKKSPDIRNHKMLPATRHRWTRRVLTPARRAAVLDIPVVWH